MEMKHKDVYEFKRTSLNKIFALKEALEPKT